MVWLQLHSLWRKLALDAWNDRRNFELQVPHVFRECSVRNHIKQCGAQMFLWNSNSALKGINFDPFSTEIPWFFLFPFLIKMILEAFFFQDSVWMIFFYSDKTQPSLIHKQGLWFVSWFRRWAYCISLISESTSYNPTVFISWKSADYSEPLSKAC